MPRWDQAASDDVKLQTVSGALIVNRVAIRVATHTRSGYVYVSR